MNDYSFIEQGGWKMNLSDQLSITARKHPDKTAFVFQDKETSYLEMEGAVRKFASQLKELGYQKGDHIALVVGNSPYYVIGMYGALRMGAIVIPINPLYTAHEMGYMLKNGDVKAVITMDVLLEKFTGIADDLPDIRHYISCETKESFELNEPVITPKMKSFSKMIEDGSPKFDAPKLDESDLAIILYTSGTTGKPKGAMLSHKNLYSNAKDVADYLTINGDDRVIAALPMFHVFCLTVSLNAPLMNGGTILIMPNFSPEEVFRTAKTYQATIFAGVPAMYNYLLQSAQEKEADIRRMRYLIYSGGAIPYSCV